MSVKIEDLPDGQAIFTTNLRIVFRDAGTRITHSLEVYEGGRWTCVATSANPIETGFDASVSPTYQEVHMQFDGHDVVQALLVGRYGAHYFSGVFRVREMQANGLSTTLIGIDVAVRSSTPVTRLTEVYLIKVPHSSLRWSLESDAGWSVAGGRLQLILEDDPNETGVTIIAVENAGRDAFRSEARALIVPEALTQRLHYGWSCAECRKTSIQSTSTRQQSETR